MHEGTKCKACPVCGGQIVVSDHWAFSYDQLLGKRGKLLKKRTKIFDALMKHCEAGTIDYFILNNKPMSQNPFKLTKVTTGWGAVHRFWGLKDGKVTLTLEEYAP